MALGYNTVVTYSDVRLYGFEIDGDYRRGVEIEIVGHEIIAPEMQARQGYLVMSPDEARKIGLALIERAAKADAINEQAVASDEQVIHPLRGPHIIPDPNGGPGATIDA